MMIREGSHSNLASQVREAATRLLETPGTLLLKVEAIDDSVFPLRHECWTKVFNAGEPLDSNIDLPQRASRVRLTAFGAFEPTRPTDTPETLLAELNRERKCAGLSAMPRETCVQGLGFDDLGFLSYQITLDVAASPAKPVCFEACSIPA